MSELFSKKEQEYGEGYKNHLFEQYRLYIDSAERVSDRRQQANNYFIAINTALVSLLGFSIFNDSSWLKIMLAALGIVICFIFYFLIRSYRQLNSGKFSVIHEIEQNLPLAPYKYEWKILGEGQNKKIYYPFSHIECLIPWIFGLIYLFLAIYFLIHP